MSSAPIEFRIVERLRKRQRQWIRTRWILLLNSILITALCVGILIFEVNNFRLHSRSIRIGLSDVAKHSDQLSQHGIPLLTEYMTMIQDQFVELALFAIAWLLLALFALWHFAKVVRDWTGNDVEALLIKLWDARKEQIDNG